MGISTKQVTRRTFVQGAGAAVAASGIAATGVAGVASADTADLTAADPTADENGNVPNLTVDTYAHPQCGEYPTPVEPAPEQTAYECDVLVVGGGLTGLNAAYAAAEAGKSVILIDKGTPGYSGLSAWPSCTAYYDPDRDADRETWDKSMRLSCFDFANLNWEDVWCDESKATYDRLVEWGWAETHPRGVDTEYFVDGNMFHDDLRGYFNAFSDIDRHKVFGRVLDEAGVTVLDHVMMIDVVENDEGVVVGAVALHYRSSTVVTIAAKATVLATGNGVIKPMGYPVGADTYDGVWVGYQHGLPITGMEFEDFHMTTAYAPSNALMHNSWQYMEQIWLTGGTVTPEKLTKRAGVEERVKTFLGGFDPAKNEVLLMDGAEEGASCSAACAAGDTTDPRTGKWTSPNPKGHVYGAAVGMCVHTAAGVWCGIDDVVGYSGIPGLYVAGDGTNGCYVGGPNYGCQRGSTSNFMSIQGYRAGKAAAEYIDGGVEAAELPADKVAEISEAALAPLSVEKGYSPAWAREALHGIMAPGWMTIAKNEAVLSAGLAQIQALKALVSGKMVAHDGHDLRLAHEVEHLLLAMELKVRAGLERKESRGYHYRTDYPFHDDNYLFYITQTKDPEGGDPIIGHVDLPERWVGDLSEPHEVRYPTFNTPEEYEMYAPKEGESK